MTKLTQDIILVLVILAGIVSFFWNPLGENMEYLRLTMAAIIGFFVKEPVSLRELPFKRSL
jgi:sugar phosphate permease